LFIVATTGKLEHAAKKIGKSPKRANLLAPAGLAVAREKISACRTILPVLAGQKLKAS
jgi:hypothetical protein